MSAWVADPKERSFAWRLGLSVSSMNGRPELRMKRTRRKAGPRHKVTAFQTHHLSSWTQAPPGTGDPGVGHCWALFAGCVCPDLLKFACSQPSRAPSQPLGFKLSKYPSC